MMRAIVAPPALSSAALTELKAWLGISRSADDAELVALLRTALEICEGFTGAMPLQSGCEEMLAASGEWQMLSAACSSDHRAGCGGSGGQSHGAGGGGL